MLTDVSELWRCVSQLTIHEYVMLCYVMCECFSGVPRRRSVGLLHGPLQHAVGSHQVGRLAYDFPSLNRTVNRRRAASQGQS